MMKKTIAFVVQLTYESEDCTPICEQSAKENLFESIENERVNCALTPDNISATELKVDVSSVNISLAFPDAVTLFVDTLLSNVDGITIEDFIDEHTTYSANYLEDSVWLVNNKQMDNRDLSELLNRELSTLDGQALIDHFREWASDINIQYEGDSEFTYWPDTEKAQ